MNGFGFIENPGEIVVGELIPFSSLFKKGPPLWCRQLFRHC
jgi:hypothetical protein